MYDPNGRHHPPPGGGGGNKMQPPPEGTLSRRERAAMERASALAQSGAAPIAMPPPELLLPRRPPSFVDPTPRVSAPVAVQYDTRGQIEPVQLNPDARRGSGDPPGARPRLDRSEENDSELSDAVAMALRGADAEAELVWLRKERDALYAQVSHWRDASHRHERACAERDVHTRQRLRKLGLWRLMGRLGLDAKVSRGSWRALAQWLHACRERLKRTGRGARVEVQPRSPSFHRRVTGTDDRPRRRDQNHNSRIATRDEDFPDSSSDDGEPGPHRWRDPGPERTKRRIEARYNGQSNGKDRDANRPDDASSLWSASDSELDESAIRRDSDSESVLSYSTLASTVRTGVNPYGDDDDADVNALNDESFDSDAVHGGKALLAAAAEKKKRGYRTVAAASAGLRAADLAKLANQRAPPGASTAAVLEWRSKAAAASEELKALQTRARKDADARRHLENELRSTQMTTREERTRGRAQEETLQNEIDALRTRVRDKEREWANKLESESRLRIDAEGELRRLQMSARASDATESASVAAAVAESKAREAKLAAEVEALRADAEVRRREYTEKATRVERLASEAADARDVAEFELRAMQESVRAESRAREIAGDAAASATRREMQLADEIARLKAESETLTTSLRDKLEAERSAREDLEGSFRELQASSRASLVDRDVAHAAQLEEMRRATDVLMGDLALARNDRAEVEAALRDLQGTARDETSEMLRAAQTRERELENQVAALRDLAAESESTFQERIRRETARAAAEASEERARVADEELRRLRLKNDAAEAELRELQSTVRAERGAHDELLAAERRERRAQLDAEIESIRAKSEEKEKELHERLRMASDARAELESELRGFQNTVRADRDERERALALAARAAEEDRRALEESLRDEASELRSRANAVEEELRARLRATEESRDDAETEIRALQASVRDSNAAAQAALKSAQDTGKEAAAKAAADAARVEREAREARETQLAADIDALRIQSEEKEREWAAKAAAAHAAAEDAEARLREVQTTARAEATDAARVNSAELARFANEAKEARDDAAAKIAAKERELAASIAAADAARAEAARSEADVARYQRTAREAESAEASTNARLREEAARLRSEAEDRERELSNLLKSEADARAAAEGALREAQVSSRGERAELEAALRAAQASSRREQDAREAAMKALEGKEKDLEELRALKEAVAEERAALEANLRDSQATTRVEKEAWEATVGALRRKEAELAAQREKTVGELESERAEKNKLELELRTMSETQRVDHDELGRFQRELADKERALEELKALREETAKAEEAWKERMAESERTRNEAETELRTLQQSSREERSDWEARSAADAAARRKALDEERANVSALEEKLATLAATRVQAVGHSSDAEELRAKLEEKETALARAEARMARMAKDLAEAEEELEERDREDPSAGGKPPFALPPGGEGRGRARSQAATRQLPPPPRAPSPAGAGSDDGRAHPIFSRVRNNRHGDVEDMLTGPHAVDPDIRDAHGNTVLAVATQNNRKRIVKAAVRAGVRLDAQNTQGQTAMHFAYAYGYDELAEYLIRKGANPMVTNCHGMRPDEGLSPDRLVGGSSKG